MKAALAEVYCGGFHYLAQVLVSLSVRTLRCDGVSLRALNCHFISFITASASGHIVSTSGHDVMAIQDLAHYIIIV